MEDVIDAGEEKLSKAQKKKLNKKLKSADGSAVATGEAAAETPSTTPASAAPSKKEKKKEKKEVAVKEAIREAAKEGAKEGAKEAAKEAAKPKGAEQELAGGLKLRDAKVGAGKTAKKGNTVGMRYIGKLQNGKVFDSNTKGKPVSGLFICVLMSPLTLGSSSPSTLARVRSSRAGTRASSAWRLVASAC
jgi:FK506-binding nuclear protein